MHARGERGSGGDWLTRGHGACADSRAAGRSILVISTLLHTCIHPRGCREMSVLMMDSRCHDDAEDHPYEQANRMIWYLLPLFSSPLILLRFNASN